MEQKKPSLNKIVGGKLKRYIKEKYGTQAKFADAYPVDVKTVSRWCNGGLDSYITTQMIADFLEIDVYALLP